MTETLAVRTDVSKWQDVEALAKKSFEAFGGAHVLCNNAGVGAGGVCWEVSGADWEWVLGVNLWGVIHGIRAFVPRMIAQGGGHVVNTASIAGTISAPGMGPYCATKHAVVTISECLHHDFTITGNAEKMHVSVLCPGWVKTNIHDAGRNRPAAAQAVKKDPTPQEQMMESLVRNAIESGIPASEVADKVLDAVVNERFYIFTHPKMMKAIERRVRGMLENEVPGFDPTAM